MLPISNQIFRLSQGHLNLLTVCPRKFQYSYLEQLNTPIDPKHEEYQILGSRFHLLMQQREMGLPINNLLQADSQLQNWMTNFTKIAPEIFTPNTNNQTFRESEHYRTLQIGDYLLTVIYDLLITDQNQAQIIDWKTYPQPPKREILAQNWQTKLYMYVLGETSKYLLENISMTYWFVQSKGQIQNIKFTYNEQQHQKTAQELNQLLNNLIKWVKDYEYNTPLPQIKESDQTCESCQYAVRCHRQKNKEITMNINQQFPNLENIAEVSL
ncbi:PD-(D/E)XK nuclease family protein [Dolichospermum sp. FACHB-1091]|uniref:PD-(D/E)XK nuclease family protein n=1 Tax=Dolichospermum sp. FACHB-1091 TaxID=2692798 RepID=UPI0016808374|nr:PD-(D/E)XK nuclease family protein [Dolichospermum sp. FACHB-1091]MBD2442791.1 PD-(D/E)XK nuclease family protein [Dolichospermum sp. FACHB-1091]